MTPTDPASPFDLHRVGDEFHLLVRPGWLQGRGAFGGLVVAWLARAMELTESDANRVVRTLAAEIVAPVAAGPATIRVEALRVGKGVSTYAARMLQAGSGGDEVVAHATASLGKRRIADRDFALPVPPDAPPPSFVDAIPIGPPLGPEFAQHVDFRPVSGLPMSAPGGLADGEARALGYVRLKEAPPCVDTAYLAAIADAYWPTLLATEPMLRPTATLSFSLDVLVDPGTLSPATTFLVASRSIAGRDGYVVEDREVFDEAGRLVALNRQTFVIIK